MCYRAWNMEYVSKFYKPFVVASVHCPTCKGEGRTHPDIRGSGYEGDFHGCDPSSPCPDCDGVQTQSFSERLTKMINKWKE